MTREKALAATRALENIEVLEQFMDEIEKLFEGYPELMDIHGLVAIPLKVELNRRNQELAEM